MKKIIVLIIILALLAIPYFVLNREDRVLDDQARAAQTGDFVRLSAGMTHYQLAGPDDGQMVVLLHGFSLPYFIWDYVFKDLSEAGFRVLRYDLYGRGYSDRPRSDYGPEFFERQLAELLDSLKIKGPVDLIGTSMGGAVVVNYSAKHPEQVRKIVLISPYGFPQKLPFKAKLLHAPLLADYLMAINGDYVLIDGVSNNFHEPLDYPDILEKFKEQMKYKGYKRALVRTMQNFMDLDFTSDFATVGRQKKNVLLIWGELDKVVPLENSAKVIEAIPQVEFRSLENRGHVPQLERPDVVDPIIIEFLKK